MQVVAALSAKATLALPRFFYLLPLGALLLALLDARFFEEDIGCVKRDAVASGFRALHLVEPGQVRDGNLGGRKHAAEITSKCGPRGAFEMLGDLLAHIIASIIDRHVFICFAVKVNVGDVGGCQYCNGFLLSYWFGLSRVRLFRLCNSVVSVN